MTTQDIRTEDIEGLNTAIGEFLVEHQAPAVSVSRVINPLLNLWSLAHDIDADAAVPVERLLTAFSSRALTTPAELSSTLDEVRAFLAEDEALTSV